MQTGVKQVFYFSAGATSLGGYLEEPFRYVPTPCSAALSPTGGTSVTRTVGFACEKVLTCKTAYTSVSGRPLAMNGPWEQRIVSVVEGLNLLGRITADRLIAQVYVTHPQQGGGPRRISFAGTHFDNLRVDNKPLTLGMNPTLLSPHEPTVDAYNQQASVSAQIQWPQLWTIAYRQAAGMVANNARANPWVHDRYSWITQTKTPDQPNPAGYSLCSVVDKIDGLAQGPVTGHCFELPELGRIFLGEVMVYPQQASLTMLRAELGCPVKGQISASCAITNGSSCPPSFFGQSPS